MIFNLLALHLLLSCSATLMISVSSAVVTKTNEDQISEDILKHNVKFYQPAQLSCSHPKSTKVLAWILPTGEVIKYPFKGHYSERVNIFDHGHLLSVRKTDNADFGLYICIVRVGNSGLMTIKHGVNVDGPYYDPKQAEKYRRNAIIGGIAAGIILVLSIILWIISDNCRKSLDKERSTVHFSSEGDPKPRMNSGLDYEEIATVFGIIDGGHREEGLEGMYAHVEERKSNQDVSVKTAIINTEEVHEIIVSADYPNIDILPENRPNAQELEMTSEKQTHFPGEMTGEDEMDGAGDRKDTGSGNNTNLQCEKTGEHEKVIFPAVVVMEDNDISEMDDLLHIPLEAEPDLDKSKDQLISLKESTVLNSPIDPVPMVSFGVSEQGDISGLLDLEHIEVKMKEKSKKPSSRHGSDHKENVIIQDGKVTIQKNIESAEDKTKETVGTEEIMRNTVENQGEIEMGAAEDKKDGEDGNDDGGTVYMRL